ncbi:hypothetical protein VTN00DRAFT_3072 [Thermoascus crustaceus]|uniref:uncharacterized protein n=1 Tax=Thermoascus crustaceus TaxID=5088 RepID=UPI003743CB1B
MNCTSQSPYTGPSETELQDLYQQLAHGQQSDPPQSYPQSGMRQSDGVSSSQQPPPWLGRTEPHRSDFSVRSTTRNENFNILEKDERPSSQSSPQNIASTHTKGDSQSTKLLKQAYLLGSRF